MYMGYTVAYMPQLGVALKMSEQKELDYNKMLTLKAVDEKDVSLQIGVWGGLAQLTVWQGNGPFKWKMANGIDKLAPYITMLERAINLKPDQDISMNFMESKFDKSAGKSTRTLLGTMIVGRDEKNILYIGLSGTAFQKPLKFPIRGAFNTDISSFADAGEASTIAAYGILNLFKFGIPAAMIATSYKREFKGNDNRGGGNRGGGGYNGGRSDSRSGGYGSDRGSSIDDEIPY